MRDILSKVMTGSMIAGAALLVAACGGGSSEANNTATNGLETDPLYDTGNVTAIEGMNGMDTGMNGMGNTTGDTGMTGGNTTGGDTGMTGGNTTTGGTGGNTTTGGNMTTGGNAQ